MAAGGRLCQVAASLAMMMLSLHSALASDDLGRKLEKKASRKESTYSKLDTAFLLLMMALLIVTVLTIWLFKVKRFRFLHETGVCMIYGMITGLVIKYAGGIKKSHYTVNCTMPGAKDIIWMQVQNGTRYSYKLSGPVLPTEGGGELEEKAVFDPEIFFFVLLPPIIFFAGYDMKKRFFFRNIGAILAYAFAGTTISCMVFGVIVYAYTKFATVYKDFDFLECLLFGALISATDPVTILAIFHDLHVDVDLYALVFGESVMNDAVAIVLFRSIESYLLDNASGVFQVDKFFSSVGVFIGVFSGSFFLGFLMGLVTALITKLTKISDFPLLETALFFLLSWSTFLMAEAAGLTGIVAVLFCGISQAHYTYNNLSDESKHNTKQIFALLNFLAENFIFSYMGLSVFTFEYHQWKPGFIAWCFIGIAIGRFLNIYPLSFLLNLGRNRKIPYNLQHMMFFSGLRGAVAFALAMRNTESVPRQMMLTTVLMIVLITVVINGGSTLSVLSYLKIRVGVNPEEEEQPKFLPEEGGDLRAQTAQFERAWIFRLWYNFDIKYMKPLFTGVGPPLKDVLPGCCQPLARILDNRDFEAKPASEMPSDEDLVVVEGELEFRRNQEIMIRPSSDSFHAPNDTMDMDEGDLGLGAINPARI
ncbi:sodium/hydrogen exchanger 9-like isoform X2 [Nematostella vectensis]|uniref:sodium/hydrogen exchanger 9-like isoform X2 n=1 Tax=Nematostella vectensis TaxID=45351 RepID=UPI0020776A7D|nr:sodium/hydrogen exchanger 9-like isoform X2 [Nematostella vectensis]